MKKLFLLPFCVLLFVTNHTLAQITFQKTYGGTTIDDGICVQQTADGGYVIGGFTSSFGAGNSDMYLIKTNNFGDTLWTRVIGDSFGNSIESVIQTTDGGYAITGD